MERLMALLVDLASKKGESPTPQTELIMSGILDSMNIAALITFLEGEIGKEIPIGELDLMKLSNAEQIHANFLQSEAV